MLMDSSNLDIVNEATEELEKSTGNGKLTRAQAKAKHPNLPEGGVWRTIKGHHVYIKDGKVVAGAGVGKTGKPIKLTKTHLDSHQEHVDNEAKKAKAATPRRAASKPKPTTTKRTASKLHQVPEKYHSVINDYLANSELARKGLTSASASKGRCDAVSEGVVNALHEKGIPARLVEAQGLKTGLDTGAHKEWVDFAKDPADLKFMGHTMIQVPEGIIDLAGSQFGKKYNGARMLSMEDFKKEWASGKINYSRKQLGSGMDVKDRFKKLTAMKQPKTRNSGPKLVVEPKKAEATAKRAATRKQQPKTKAYHEMNDAELEQAVKDTNEKYWHEKRVKDTEMSKLRTGQKTELDELRLQKGKINKMRFSKKRTNLAAENERAQSEMMKRHSEEISKLQAKHDAYLKPYFDARKESAETQSKRTRLRALHEQIMKLPGDYANAFEQAKEEIARHQAKLDDGRTSESSKEHARMSINRARARVEEFEAAAAAHGLDRKAPKELKGEQPVAKKQTQPKPKAAPKAASTAAKQQYKLRKKDEVVDAIAPKPIEDDYNMGAFTHKVPIWSSVQQLGNETDLSKHTPKKWGYSTTHTDSGVSLGRVHATRKGAEQEFRERFADSTRRAEATKQLERYKLNSPRRG